MKRPNEWLAVLTVGSAVLCLYALFGMAIYYVWAKLDPSMERMWDMKRQFRIPLLIGSFVVGLPFWIRFVRACIRNRKDK